MDDLDVHSRSQSCGKARLYSHVATQMLVMVDYVGEMIVRIPESVANMDRLSNCSSCYESISVQLGMVVDDILNDVDLHSRSKGQR